MTTKIVIFFSLILYISQYGIAEELNTRRVHNGEELDFLSNKHLVKMNFNDLKQFKSCSGSIIGSRWILTAAHCVQGTRQMEIFRYNQEDKIYYKLSDAHRFYMKDPTYNIDGDTLDNIEKDLGLAFTDQRIDFNLYVQPIRLSSRVNIVGLKAMTSGFGITELGIVGARQGIVRLSKCPYKVVTSLVCSEGEVWVDHGDSGGSLVHDGELIGVNVALEEPVNVYNVSVYVSVAVNLNWIKAVTAIY